MLSNIRTWLTSREAANEKPLECLLPELHESILSSVDAESSASSTISPGRFGRSSNSIASLLLPDGLLPWRARHKLHITSWLDGLRGIASFIVFLHHMTLAWAPEVRKGYGSNLRATNPFSLPVVRIWLSGGAMVSTFFVISGYALSLKVLGLARQGRHDEAFRSIASSTFRRGPRLYIPMLGITLISAIMSQMQMFDAGYARVQSNRMFSQLEDWFFYSIEFMNPFTGQRNHNKFEIVCWSLPVEFLGSLWVFACCLGLAKSSTTFRTIALILMMLSWMFIASVDQMLFTGGMVCADIHYLHSPSQQQQPPLRSLSPTRSSGSPARSRHSLRRNLDLMAVFVVLLWLMSQPEPADFVAITPGYRTLSRMTPNRYRGANNHTMFFPCVGSIAVVALIDFAGPDSWLQAMFCTRFVQWLGKISFSLYLCHMMIQFSVVSRTMRLFGGWCGVAPTTSGIVILATLACLPILFFVSEVLTAVLDRGSVWIAKTMYRW